MSNDDQTGDGLPKTAVNAELAQGSAGRADQEAAAPIRYAVPPLSQSFTEDELVRVGRSTATAPANRLGLLIVRRSPQPVRLGQIVPLRGPRHVLGRGRGVACFLDDEAAAEFSAIVVHELTVAGGGYVLHVPAPGCALLNGTPTHRVTPLASGDVITLGRTDLVFFEVAFDAA